MNEYPNVVSGAAVYVRKILPKRHGKPADFARRCQDDGLSWVAFAGPWHDNKGPRFINKPSVLRPYMDAAANLDIAPWVWGYPWQGTEKLWADQMCACANGYPHGISDDELGANPSRSKVGPKFAKAEAHAVEIVERMKDIGFEYVGLSTFGSGSKMGWFPLKAYVVALARVFPNESFVGGQTYTENKRVDPSIADFVLAIDRHGRNPNLRNKLLVQFVPNFGLYKKVGESAVPKTHDELIVHCTEFIDEAEPVKAAIGWAENFLTKNNRPALRKFGEWLRRGVCAAPMGAPNFTDTV